MTVRELADAVIHLGFQSSLAENDALFREAAARALHEVDAACPRLCTAPLYHLPPSPLLATGSEEPLRGEKTFSLPSALSYTARLFGEGGFSVQTENETFFEPFSAPYGGTPLLLSGRVPAGAGESRFVFTPRPYATLLSFAVYDCAFAGEVPDPQGETLYDLCSLFADFAALDGAPRDRRGAALCEGTGREVGTYALREGRFLALPNRAPAVLTVSYRKAAVLPEAGEIPLSGEAATLLPLLCAAYVWLDEDPDKAVFYLSRYREGLARLTRPARGAAAFFDRTEWG